MVLHFCFKNVGHPKVVVEGVPYCKLTSENLMFCNISKEERSLYQSKLVALYYNQ